ncbi:MAG: tetratricopeptide repeat protein [Pseudomonadota bacterium]
MTTIQYSKRSQPLESPQIDSLLAKGFEAHRSGDLDAAETCYRMVLEKEPDSGQALYLLGLAKAAWEDWTEAENLIRRSLRILPENADMLANLAATQLALDKADMAEKNLRRALVLSPDHVESRVNLGIALRKQGRPQEALKPLREALKKAPNHPRAQDTIANALEDLSRHALDARDLSAASSYLSELEKCRPHHVNTLLLRGNLSLADGDIDGAENSYRKSLSLDPEEPDAHANLGSVMAARLNLDEAISDFDRAIALQPNSSEYRFNRSLIYLLRGDFKKGWVDYDQRRLPDGSLAEGEWLQFTPDTISGMRVLVFAEQGFGDSLQFVRYLPMLKATGAEVHLVCQPELRALFESSVHIDGFPEDFSGDWDIRIPLLSLPRFFSTDLDSIPGAVPYLFPDQKRMPAFADVANETPVKLGIFWQGRKMHRNRFNRRSCSPQDFCDLGTLSGVKLYSLQKGEGGKMLDLKDVPVFNLAPRMRDFADTAAAVASLDLIISVDTAVAHLGGAMGKPVWTLLPYSADWRWLLGREDTPWYPTMRLWRQPEPGDWESVFVKVKEALSELVHKTHVRENMVHGNHIRYHMDREMC